VAILIQDEEEINSFIFIYLSTLSQWPKIVDAGHAGRVLYPAKRRGVLPVHPAISQ
jgi:hypothetical protein